MLFRSNKTEIFEFALINRRGEELSFKFDLKNEHLINVYDVNYKEDVLVGYRWYDTKKIEPLYPFGYGLSYTSFEVDNLKLDKEELKKGETLTVTVDVANIGKVGGEEVVQLYIRDLVGSVTRPVKELKGFQKLYLKAGEKKSLTFVLTEEDLAFCGADMKMQVEPVTSETNRRRIRSCSFSLVRPF